MKLTTPKRVVAIVGDDYGVVHALKLSVEAAGYRVAIWSPAAFLELASDENIACLLLDHHMPQTNGLAIAAHLRTKGSNIPIALMSGTASPAIREQAAELGIETVPEKPFHEDELLAFIAANLD